MFFASECCANTIKTQQRINKEEETKQANDGRTSIRLEIYNLFYYLLFAKLITH